MQNNNDNNNNNMISAIAWLFLQKLGLAIKKPISIDQHCVFYYLVLNCEVSKCNRERTRGEQKNKIQF